MRHVSVKSEWSVFTLSVVFIHLPEQHMIGGLRLFPSNMQPTATKCTFRYLLIIRTYDDRFNPSIRGEWSDSRSRRFYPQWEIAGTGRIGPRTDLDAIDKGNTRIFAPAGCRALVLWLSGPSYSHCTAWATPAHPQCHLDVRIANVCGS